jgi:uncharacterized membrane protein
MLTATHLHAMLVHFPIALLLSGFLADLIYLLTKKPFFKTTSLFLLMLGALGAVAAYLTGNAAGEGMDDGSSLSQAVEIHEGAAMLTMLLSLLAAGFRLLIEFTNFKPKWGYATAVVLSAIVVASVVRTGFYGGELVYKHGTGVELELSLTPEPEN